MKTLITLVLLAATLNVQANNCDTVANKAFNAMLDYQYTGEVTQGFESVKSVQRVINGFDKKAEANKYAWSVFDSCEAK